MEYRPVSASVLIQNAFSKVYTLTSEGEGTVCRKEVLSCVTVLLRACFTVSC